MLSYPRQIFYDFGCLEATYNPWRHPHYWKGPHRRRFREDARNTTKRSIDGKNPEKNIDEAVLYLLEELSFVLSCHLIYGAEKTAYLYHKNWEIYEKIIAGEYDGKMRENFRLVLTGITKNVTKK